MKSTAVGFCFRGDTLVVKIFGLITMMILFGSALSADAAARTDTDPPGLDVVEHRWFSYSPLMPSIDPSAMPPNENYPNGDHGRRYRQADDSQRESFSKGWTPGSDPTADRIERPAAFTYQMRIANTGPKEIRGILWDYIFSDPLTGKELARHTFLDEHKLTCGQTRTLTATSLRPPTWVVSVGMLSKKENKAYLERVEIRGVAYADGSNWIAN
jgi:hypothetical protein